MCLQPEDFPRVMIGVFFEEATPFADVFFEHVAQQIYPKDRIDIYIHYGVSWGSLSKVVLRIRIIYLFLFQTQETSAKTTSGRCRRGHLSHCWIYEAAAL